MSDAVGPLVESPGQKQLPIVTFLIKDQSFTISLELLRAATGSWFANLADASNDITQEPIQLDRDPDVFKLILNYLKTGALELPLEMTEESYKTFLHDAHYFNLPNLEYNTLDIVTSSMVQALSRKTFISFRGARLLGSFENIDFSNECPIPEINYDRSTTACVAWTTNTDLSSTTMYGLNMTRAKLCHADLTQSVLSHIDLTNANLNGVNFSNAKLSHVDFTGAQLQNAIFTGATLSDINFTNTLLNGTSFKHANLVTNINFTGANLSQAELTGFNLSRVCTSLSKVILSGTQLANTELSHLDLSNISFDGANLSGANLAHSDLTDTNMTETNLTGTNLTKTLLIRSNLAQAIIDGTNFTGARCIAIQLIELKQAHASSASSTATPLPVFKPSSFKHTWRAEHSSTILTNSCFDQCDMTAAVLPRPESCSFHTANLTNAIIIARPVTGDFNASESVHAVQTAIQGARLRRTQAMVLDVRHTRLLTHSHMHAHTYSQPFV